MAFHLSPWPMRSGTLHCYPAAQVGKVELKSDIKLSWLMIDWIARLLFAENTEAAAWLVPGTLLAMNNYQPPQRLNASTPQHIVRRIRIPLFNIHHVQTYTTR